MDIHYKKLNDTIDAALAQTWKLNSNQQVEWIISGYYNESPQKDKIKMELRGFLLNETNVRFAPEKGAQYLKKQKAEFVKVFLITEYALLEFHYGSSPNAFMLYDIINKAELGVSSAVYHARYDKPGRIEKLVDKYRFTAYDYL